MDVEVLLDTYEKLGPLERKVLLTFLHRLYAGQRKYGKLSEDKKEWTWEAAEEALDASVYLSVSLVAATNETKRRYFADLGESEVRRDLEEPYVGPY